ncbi:MAG: alanine--tRNA ligase [Candidatus Latescibacteria bacterium]|jgi:alanyl-tRNA synthetase|nr:alanine--tRNA ligase [Candidatus Latescibacterota bacterium]
MKKASDIREEFQAFFESKQHTRVPSAPVVPQDDPTLLFTNAGMNQFKDVFLGTGKRPYTRAADTQKCLRVSGKHNDLEEVGFSPSHHTFFEMLGNWSFGDYFKEEAIAWAWELITGVWKLPKERVWATVFEGDESDGLDADEEAEKLWKTVTDIPANRILRLSKEDNFWEMGETGPCGPCSEMHFYVGDDPASQADVPDLDGEDYVEIWNLVFIQFNRSTDGSLQPLPEKHVDTGMGFERICSIIQGVKTNYDTDLFLPIIAAISEITKQPYNAENQVAMRVIADHIRTLAFTIADGALPSNEGRGYVLRRILRRASRFGRNLQMQEPFIHKLTDVVTEVMGEAFPELIEKKDHIARVILAEEDGFGKTLDRGLEIFEEVSKSGQVSGEDAFRLYDTYGFPIDLTQLMATEKGITVDEAGFEQAMQAQQTRSREAGKKTFASQEVMEEGFLPDEHSEFIGYETLETDSKIVAWQPAEDGQVDLYLDVTPFYAESGGQVGDRGCISGNGIEVDVHNTFKQGEAIVHRGRIVSGDQDVLRDIVVTAAVDVGARISAARNHTATHLMHEAMRQILGEHVHQAGSLVTPDRLRFDFTHFEGVTPEQLQEIERIVNDVVRQDLAVDISYADLEKAKEMGAMMLFTEKYGDVVRVVRVGDFSLELCGGTHTNSTGQLGLFQVTQETGTAAGVRRIEAVTGLVAEGRVRAQRDVLADLEVQLSAQVNELPEKVSLLLTQNKALERELQALRREQAGSEMDELVHSAQDVNGLRVVAADVSPSDMDDFRDMGDGLRNALGSGVGVIGATLDGKASIIAVVTDDLISRGIQAGTVVKAVAQLVGGGGGGRPHMAQAGGKFPEKIGEALAQVPSIVRAQLEG